MATPGAECAVYDCFVVVVVVVVVIIIIIIIIIITMRCQFAAELATIILRLHGVPARHAIQQHVSCVSLNVLMLSETATQCLRHR